MSKQTGKRGLKVTQASDITADQLALETDVVVVGSGAGGAIAAYELAKAGKKVVVLEAGPYVPSDQFTEMLAVSMGRMYAEGGGQSNTTGDLTVLQGSCVGGSTVVNAALCFRTPDHFLEMWGQDFGLTNLTPKTMEPYFEKVEKNLSISRTLAEKASDDANLLKTGCDEAGVEWKHGHRNVNNCAMSAACLAGCYSDRKQSMLVTYLPWAVELGARIFSDTRVTKVNEAAGKVSGVEAEIIDQKTGKKKASLSIKAGTVVLAAGAVQTPVLLLRSGIANSSGQVGKNFACHPTVSMTGYFPQFETNFLGAWHSMHVDEFTRSEDGGFLLLQAVQEPLEASFEAEPGTGKPYLDYMSKSKNLARFIPLIHDRNHGEILWEDGVKKIKYDMHPKDFPAMQAGMKKAAEVLFAAGAEKVMLPTSNQAEIKFKADIGPVIDSLKNEPARFRYTSYHPQGSCRMASDPKTSVVGPTGESHDVTGLWVVDGSILPTSIGYNPSETIYALASYISDQMIAKSG